MGKVIASSRIQVGAKKILRGGGERAPELAGTQREDGLWVKWMAENAVCRIKIRLRRKESTG